MFKKVGEVVLEHDCEEWHHGCTFTIDENKKWFEYFITIEIEKDPFIEAMKRRWKRAVEV